MYDYNTIFSEFILRQIVKPFPNYFLNAKQDKQPKERTISNG